MKKSFKLLAMTALIFGGSLVSAPKAHALFWVKTITGACINGEVYSYQKNYITGSLIETVSAC